MADTGEGPSSRDDERRGNRDDTNEGRNQRDDNRSRMSSNERGDRGRDRDKGQKKSRDGDGKGKDDPQGGNDARFTVKESPRMSMRQQISSFPEPLMYMRPQRVRAQRPELQRAELVEPKDPTPPPSARGGGGRRKRGRRRRGSGVSLWEQRRLPAYPPDLHPCVHLVFKSPTIPRESLSRQQHIALLSQPRPSPWSPAVERDSTLYKFRVAPPSWRLNAMAAPNKRYLRGSLRESYHILSPTRIQRMVDMLQEEMLIARKGYGINVEFLDPYEDRLLKSPFKPLMAGRKDKAMALVAAAALRDDAIRGSKRLRKWAVTVGEKVGEQILLWIQEPDIEERTGRQQALAAATLVRLRDLAGATGDHGPAGQFLELLAERLAIWMDNVLRNKADVQDMRIVQHLRRDHQWRRKRPVELGAGFDEIAIRLPDGLWWYPKERLPPDEVYPPRHRCYKENVYLRDPQFPMSGSKPPRMPTMFPRQHHCEFEDPCKQFHHRPIDEFTKLYHKPVRKPPPIHDCLGLHKHGDHKRHLGRRHRRRRRRKGGVVLEHRETGQGDLTEPPVCPSKQASEMKGPEKRKSRLSRMSRMARLSRLSRPVVRPGPADAAPMAGARPSTGQGRPSKFARGSRFQSSIFKKKFSIGRRSARVTAFRKGSVEPYMAPLDAQVKGLKDRASVPPTSRPPIASVADWDTVLEGDKRPGSAPLPPKGRKRKKKRGVSAAFPRPRSALPGQPPGAQPPPGYPGGAQPPGYPGAPPPPGYPGGAASSPPGFPGGQPPPTGYPGAGTGYPGTAPGGGYPGAPPGTGYPGAGYPGAGYPGAGYPGAAQGTVFPPGHPGAATGLQPTSGSQDGVSGFQQLAGYPGAPPPSGYPGAPPPSGYPGAPPPSGYPGAPPPAGAGYPGGVPPGGYTGSTPQGTGAPIPPTPPAFPGAPAVSGFPHHEGPPDKPPLHFPEDGPRAGSPPSDRMGGATSSAPRPSDDTETVEQPGGPYRDTSPRRGPQSDVFPGPYKDEMQPTESTHSRPGTGSRGSSRPGTAGRPGSGGGSTGVPGTGGPTGAAQGSAVPPLTYPYLGHSYPGSPYFGPPGGTFPDPSYPSAMYPGGLVSSEDESEESTEEADEDDFVTEEEESEWEEIEAEKPAAEVIVVGPMRDQWREFVYHVNVLTENGILEIDRLDESHPIPVCKLRERALKRIVDEIYPPGYLQGTCCAPDPKNLYDPPYGRWLGKTMHDLDEEEEPERFADKCVSTTPRAQSKEERPRKPEKRRDEPRVCGVDPICGTYTCGRPTCVSDPGALLRKICEAMAAKIQQAGKNPPTELRKRLAGYLFGNLKNQIDGRPGIGPVSQDMTAMVADQIAAWLEEICADAKMARDPRATKPTAQESKELTDKIAEAMKEYWRKWSKGNKRSRKSMKKKSVQVPEKEWKDMIRSVRRTAETPT